jgi:O-acetyl-ADP-ribose deacetylase (regulator of RNase III)
MNIVQGDITKFNPALRPSAIVNAANVTLLGGGGVDGAIHRAAGPGLKEECEKLPEFDPHNLPGVRCLTGDARITPAGNLSVDYVIHTVGPIWPASSARAPRFPGEIPAQTAQEACSLLARCLNSCFTLAIAKDVKSLAFSAISCGVFGGDISVFSKVLHETMTAIEADGHTLPEVTVILFQDWEMSAFLQTWPSIDYSPLWSPTHED